LSCGGLHEQVRERPGQAVDPDQDRHVSPVTPLDDSVQFRTGAVATGAVFVVNDRAADGLQCVDLRVSRLPVDGNAGVADGAIVKVPGTQGWRRV
jgi:hypothetical protein